MSEKPKQILFVMTFDTVKMYYDTVRISKKRKLSTNTTHSKIDGLPKSIRCTNK